MRTAAVFAVVAVALATVWSAEAGIVMRNVTFASGPTSSGDITLYGTMVMPSDATPSQPVPGVVLVTGSGPNDRWENIGPLKPFYYIAMNLASKGFAVLTYDKRSCTGAMHPICSHTKPCTAPNTPAGCLNIANITLYDFASDAATAATFLSGQAGVQPTGVTILGHSQGCTIAMQAASTVTSIVNRVVLLMGDGVGPGALLRDQAQVQLPIVQEAAKYWEKQPPSATQKAMVAKFQHDALSFNCTIQVAMPQYELLRNGTLSVGENAVVCPLGTYWDGGHNFPTGLSCPGRCGTGLCELGKNTPECLAACKVGLELAACQPLRFANSWVHIAENSTRLAAMHALAGGSILAINSWQDLLVVPATFKPLHALLDTLTDVDVTIHTVYNVTHDLTTIGSTSTGVSPKVLALLDAFMA